MNIREKLNNLRIPGVVEYKELAYLGSVGNNPSRSAILAEQKVDSMTNIVLIHFIYDKVVPIMIEPILNEDWEGIKVNVQTQIPKAKNKILQRILGQRNTSYVELGTMTMGDKVFTFFLRKISEENFELIKVNFKELDKAHIMSWR